MVISDFYNENRAVALAMEIEISLMKGVVGKKMLQEIDIKNLILIHHIVLY